MRVWRNLGVAAAVLAAAWGGTALADDPRDPAMTPDAIARDAATIRRLNRDQLAYVRQRDAGYAQGWRDNAAARSDDADEGYTADSYDAGRRSYADSRADYAAERRDYAEQRREYDRQMREWRQDVAACRAGYYEHCDR